MMMRLFHYQRSILVDILAILFGISSWISINGLWVELPLLVGSLPEGWNLPSYLSIIVQMANLGPITYSIFRGFFKDSLPTHIIIILLLVIGSIASLLMPLFWDWTLILGGESRSAGLFLLVFFLSLVDCTSSVLFLPYMSVFKSIYLYSYFIGEGMSGFVPSVAALLQGVSGNPVCQNVTLANGTVIHEAVHGEARFSISSFFIFLCSMMVVSLISFLLLQYLPTARKEHASVITSTTTLLSGTSPSPTHSTSSSSENISQKSDEENDKISHTDVMVECNSQDGINCGQRKGYNIPFLLAVQCFICFLSNGALPSIQSYSCLPYGNTFFHLAVTLSAMANPTMAFFASFFPCKRQYLIGLFTTVGSLMAAYILATALSSPEPLFGQTTGGVLVVLTWVAFGALFSYVKVCIGSICREANQLFYCGVFTQLGSAGGALLMFILVNQVQLFQSYYVTC